MTSHTLTGEHDVRPSAPRVTSDDDLFIRMDRALGVPLANQVVWRLRTPIDVSRFADIGDRLARTPLNRVLRRNRIPFARDTWIDAGLAGGLVDYDSATIDDDELIGWLNGCAATYFDLATGPVWRLSAVRLHTGGGVVALTSSHAVGDGWSGVRNVLSAVDPAAGLVSLPVSPPSTAADVRDAVAQIYCIASNLGKLAADSVRRRRPSPTTAAVVTSHSIPRPPGRQPLDAAEPTVHPPLAIVGFDSAEWERIAQRHGGTSNALFIAITVGLVVAAGRASFDDDVRVIVPMSRQDPADDDLRANVTTGLDLDVPARLSRDNDLATIRLLAKQMYQRSREVPAPLLRLQPLIQSLSDATLLRLNRDAATPLAVASNVGVFDDRFARLGTEDVNAVALRSVPQHVSAQLLARLRGGIACWLNVTGPTTTLTVGSYDPFRIPDQSALAALLDDECLRWGLPPAHW